VVILSNALEYIQDHEWRNQRLRQENIALGLVRIVYGWKIIAGIINNYL